MTGDLKLSVDLFASAVARRLCAKREGGFEENTGEGKKATRTETQKGGNLGKAQERTEKWKTTAIKRLQMQEKGNENDKNHEGDSYDETEVGNASP